MIIDALDFVSDAERSCDVCIAGAGAAGITIARELAGSAVDVLLMEGGGLDFSVESQDAYSGALVGRDYAPLDAGRLRFFGGSTNHWEGSCAPLDPIDFETRPWVEHSGWPFGRADLDPFYARAQVYCRLGPPRYDADYWIPRRNKGRPLPLPADRVVSRIVQASPPVRFGEEYRADLAAAKNVTVMLNAGLTELEPGPDGRKLELARFATIRGTSVRVRPRIFVLCLGGIENARMLLASNRLQPAGLGNGYDLVGRFFMDHPIVEGAQVMLSRPDLSIGFYQPDAFGDYGVNAYLQLAEAALRRHGLTNLRMPFAPRTRYEASEGIESYHAIREAVSRAELPSDLLSHIGNVIGDIDMVAEAVTRKLGGGSLTEDADRLALYAFDTMTEQTPNYDSRVRLSRDTDAFGVPRVELDWRIAKSDRENLWRGYEIAAAAFGTAGVGRLRLLRDREEALWGRHLSWGNHHMGTTRMHASPRRGVTDADGRVHGLANLYIAGSSLFPTGGHVPPTLTIVALALRLADHLRSVAGRA